MMKERIVLKELASAHNALALRYLKLQLMLKEAFERQDISSYKIEKKMDMYRGRSYIISIYIHINNECRINISKYFICAEKKGKSNANCAFALSKDIEEDLHRVLKFFGYEK